jgi:UDP-N-acetylmuramoylalanine--D-glutamate ligase
MKLADLRNKKILLLGYGKEGKTTEQFLKAYLPDTQIGYADKAEDPNYLEKQKDYDVAVRSPGIPKSQITIPYTTATNLFFENVKGKTIGITGTKGKSTTNSLIYHLLKTAGKSVYLVGNIGNPMLETLMKVNGPDDIFVVELSSYQLDDIEYSPDISIVVSLYPDHLDYHGSLDDYYESKHNIIKHAGSDDIFIYNPRFEKLKEWAVSAQCKTERYDETLSMSVDTGLMGEHNRQNIAAAITAVKHFNLTEEQIFEAIKTFQPLPHRLQNVGTFKGITFYDDAISTTPESTIKALEALPDTATLFLGGLDRGYDFTPLVEYLKKSQIKNFVFFPPSGETIRAMLKAAGIPEETMLSTDSMEKAVDFAYQHTPENTVCLLSTASPSYSIWKNFEEKGDLFQQFVKQYAQKESPQKQDNPGSGPLS